MSGYSHRATREANVPTVLLQGRVAPEAHAYAHEAARQSGVSLSYYLEHLILDLVQENNGALPLVERPVRGRTQQAELPIDTD